MNNDKPSCEEERRTLASFNRIQKEYDTVYHDYARSVGLSDAAFWVLYSIATSSEELTQRELSTSWFFPVQTVNSALSSLVKTGWLTLESIAGNHKSKRICITPAGETAIQRFIRPLVAAEDRALSRFGREDYESYLGMTKRHVTFLKEELAQASPATDDHRRTPRRNGNVEKDDGCAR